MKYLFFLLLPVISAPVAAQESLSRLFSGDSLQQPQPVTATFKSDHIVNGQSNETLHRQDLVVNISHRFDDIAGKYGGIKTFFGLDNSTDIKIQLEYGISDRLTAGLARAKGAPEARATAIGFNSETQLWEGSLKFRLLQQTTDNKVPLAITLFSNAVISSRAALDDPTSDISFSDFGDRWSFTGQAIIARKFSDNFSLAVLPTYSRRNLVAFGDMNNLFSLGLGGRIKFTRHMAIIMDCFLPFRSRESRDYFKQQDITFYPPLAIGWEIETGGHVFHINFTNSTALLENQFIPYTTRSWTHGGFRWGFNISRTFSLSPRQSRKEGTGYGK
ncbi:DUF5777 family beta-barrel protein [Compostibacter hankyongensis]|uniref:DUF5777 family beta-barrel protein n=1 Tax=Compostibacter hankyongensis TaxID=1007089 RepID=A0ABP8FPC0_9BACT